MEYILITAFQIIGIGFQVLFKVIELDKKFQDDMRIAISLQVKCLNRLLVK